MKKRKDPYKKTMYACFVGYITQAVINNFAPLLFLTFQSSYSIPLTQITVLVTFNFGIQLLVDLLSTKFVDRIGYRPCILAAHVFAAAGLIGLAFLPDLLPDPFAGLLLSVGLYAAGSGLIEVLISPIMEACPTENKEKAMSLLHSFYCWGQVGVVLLSTLFFALFGIENWKILSLIWAIIPLANLVVFAKAPIGSLIEEGARGMTLRELFSTKLFWALMLIMVSAGASEQSISQWASTFAEKGLGVSKAVGDLAGPMAFAFLMGVARAFYGKYGDRINLDRFMTLSGVLCVVSYLCISLIPSPIVGLVGCAVCGLSVGIMWPGGFSKAAACLRNGGTALFALLALGGDLGCTSGPTLVGIVSGAFGDNLKTGILAAAVFPVLLLLGIWLCSRRRQAAKAE
ncbi:MAG TPA: MFS transporter [Firmicutes bacterium]|mgnify:CR=1 FL=1|nr:MFS transporter [Bacillota bacterium]